MGLSNLLQEFSSTVPGTEKICVMSERERDAQITRHYEQGYDAGWEDALALKRQEIATLSEALKESLQDLEFSLTEARRLALAELMPVLVAFVDHVFTPSLQDHQPTLIADKLEQMLAEGQQGKIELFVSPGDRDGFRPVLQAAFGKDVRLGTDAGLQEGQISVRLGETETLFDPLRTAAALKEVVAGFAMAVEPETAHS